MFSINKYKSIYFELLYYFIFVLWFYLILFEITLFGHLSIGVHYIQVCLSACFLFSKAICKY